MGRAFMEDPVWSFLVDDPDHREVGLTAFFTTLARCGVGWGWLHATHATESVTLWSPPATELVREDQLEDFLAQVPAVAPGREERLLEFFSRTMEHHPHEAHWYLSVFATDTAHRGRGIGLELLKRDLAIIDETHMPCYLESSNPRNEQRYRSVGFEVMGAFDVADDGPEMTLMWREAR